MKSIINQSHNTSILVTQKSLLEGKNCGGDDTNKFFTTADNKVFLLGLKVVITSDEITLLGVIIRSTRST